MYSENKKGQNKEKIIDSAQKFIISRGLNCTSLEDIAGEAGVTKRTVINIFGSKTNLVYLVMIRLYDEFYEFMDEYISADRFIKQSGLEQIMDILVIRAKYYRDEPYRARLIVEVESLIPQTMEEEKSCQKYLENVDKIAEYFSNPLKKGKKDASINPYIDEEEAKRILFVAFGAVAQRLSHISVNISLSKKLEAEEVMRSTLKVIRRYLMQD